MDVNSLSHTKWNCKYHIVFAPKFRRKVAYGQLNITLRRSRLSGVARATIPDKQSHLVTNYCTMF